MKKDYYKILEVDKNFTEDQLKKNYKKLCLKYHPDRLAGKSEEEKKAAEEKFKDIQEAYECLSDANKRAHYDRFGSMDGYGQGWSAGADMFSHFSDFFGDFNFGGFGDMFSGTFRKTNDQTAKVGKTYKISVNVTIEELFKGAKKKFKFDREVRCEHCHGKGGEGVETCSACNGTGMITTTQRSGFGIIQNSRPCPYCGGTGKTVKKTCTHCHGSGMKNVKSEVEITIPVGVENGFTNVLRGKGGESPSGSMGKPGDLIYTVYYNIDTSKYQVTHDAVYELLNVNYYDLILGTTLDRTLPSGQKVKVEIPQLSKNEDTVVLRNKGFRNKHYIYVLQAVFPKHISKEEKNLLEKIQKLNS